MHAHQHQAEPHHLGQGVPRQAELMVGPGQASQLAQMHQHGPMASSSGVNAHHSRGLHSQRNMPTQPHNARAALSSSVAPGDPFGERGFAQQKPAGSKEHEVDASPGSWLANGEVRIFLPSSPSFFARAAPASCTTLF